MKSRGPKSVLVVTALPLLGFGAALALADKATIPLIEYAAYDLTRTHGCTELLSFPSTSVVQGMGQRSIPILRRRLAEPGLGHGGKMILADQLCQLGDEAQFQVFIDALHSDKQRHQAMAAWFMQRYPRLCERHLPAILQAGRRSQHSQYQQLLLSMARQSPLPKDKKEALMESIMDWEYQNRGATKAEIAKWQRQFRL